MPARKKSTEAKKLSGSYRPDRDTSIVEDVVAVGDIEMPEGLSPREQSLWNHAIEAAPKGLLKRIDQTVLRTWVSSTAIAHEASEQMATEGSTLKLPNGYLQKHPACDVWSKATTAQNRASQQLGFDPLSRSKVKSEIPKEPEYNAFAKFSTDAKLREMIANGELHSRNIAELRAEGRNI